MTVNDEEMLVVRAIRQSFETHSGPGSSVNATSNPYFIAMTGSFDLLKAAQLVLLNLQTLRDIRARAQANDEAVAAARKAAEARAETEIAREKAAAQAAAGFKQAELEKAARAKAVVDAEALALQKTRDATNAPPVIESQKDDPVQ